MNELTTECPYELPKNLKFVEELDHGAFGQVILVKDIRGNFLFSKEPVNTGCSEYTQRLPQNHRFETAPLSPKHYPKMPPPYSDT